jgi:hypothetical protein
LLAVLLFFNLNTPSTPTPTLPIADSTTQGRYWGKLQMMSATSRMRSASRTDDPPNLYTTLLCTAGHSTAQHSTAQHSTAQHSTAQHSTAQQGAAQSGKGKGKSRFAIVCWGLSWVMGLGNCCCWLTELQLLLLAEALATAALGNPD